MIALVDAGTGNLRSVEKALRHALTLARRDDELRVTSSPDDVLAADRLVVPGQGAFGDCGRALSPEAPLGRALVESITAGRPYLGICLGMQVLFEQSDEAPDCRGLGILRGRVVRIPDGLRDGASDGRKLKVPHMGWNELALRLRPHPVLGAVAALQQSLAFYFVHGYHVAPEEPALVEATVEYGPLRLVAAVALRNVLGVQFHPEKSQQAGLALLGAFLEWNPSC